MNWRSVLKLGRINASRITIVRTVELSNVSRSDKICTNSDIFREAGKDPFKGGTTKWRISTTLLLIHSSKKTHIDMFSNLHAYTFSTDAV